jgi:hypothetical protein
VGGALLLAVGIWAESQKESTSNITTLGGSILNPVLMLLISGSVIFVVGFFGCVGALRENTILLIIVSHFMALFTFLYRQFPHPGKSMEYSNCIFQVWKSWNMTTVMESAGM